MIKLRYETLRFNRMDSMSQGGSYAQRFVVAHDKADVATPHVSVRRIRLNLHLQLVDTCQQWAAESMDAATTGGYRT